MLIFKVVNWSFYLGFINCKWKNSIRNCEYVLLLSIMYVSIYSKQGLTYQTIVLIITENYPLKINI